MREVTHVVPSIFCPRPFAYLKALSDVDDTWLKKEPNIALFSVINRHFSKPTSNAWQQSPPPELIRPWMAARDDIQGLDREQHLARKQSA